ncbi:MAG: M20/M25/M40 family metallo-hydrolase [Lachnospiraceae bacterium]|nr:M20/M25/M40 family metallo-hydrolase [Lachnospiraceae bacterium]
MRKYNEVIDSWIDSKKEEMLEDLKTLVRINSQKGTAEEGKPFGEGPAAALSAAQEMMERYGFSVRNYENYVVTGDLEASSPGTATSLADVAEGAGTHVSGAAGTGQKGLDILAHLDVVPVTEDWTVTQPFEPKIVDGRIYGRGTADDKGPAIAALYALRAIRELGIPMKKGVRLVLGSDEECGSSDLAYYYGIEQETPYTFTPDADFPVINIEKGRLEGKFHAEFVDTAEKDTSVSVQRLEKQGCPEYGNSAGELQKDGADNKTLQPRILSLKSGDKANVVPGRATLILEGLPEDVVRAAADAVTEETGVTFAVTKLADDAAQININPGEASECDGAGSGKSSEREQLRIDARGQAAHASTPQEGKNALTATLRLVAKLAGMTDCDGEKCGEAVDDDRTENGGNADLERTAGLEALLALDRLFPYEDTCGRALGVYREEAQSGAVTLCFSILDYTPERLSGTFDARLPIGCTEENTKKPIMEALASHGMILGDRPMTKPHCVPGDSAFVRILLDSYEHYTGIKGEPISTGGGTYVHGLERGVAFGCMTPDVDNHMHGDDEFMVIDRLVMSAKIFADAIVRICNEL